MAQDADAASTEDAAGTDDNTDVKEGSQDGQESTEDQWDPERAKATILKQRESEAALKAQVKEMKEALAQYQEADEAKAEAEKTLETKVAERDQALKAKDAEIADLHVRYSFEKEALVRGVADPELAFLAAKEQGFLGQYDPKVGTVGEHDWDGLGEKYSSFKTQQDAQASSGDAGARGKAKADSPGDQFNAAVRSALRGRR